MYFSDVWIAFLGEQIIRQTVEMSIIRCPGCQSKLKSPILHQHHHHSLLEKFKLYFEEIRGTVLPSIPELYEQFKDKLPHSDDPQKDAECYMNTGRQYLIMITSEALYWGRYQSELLDGFVDEGFHIKKKRTAPRKQATKSEISKKKARMSNDLLEELLQSI